MNFLKRALWSVKYHIKNTSLMFVIFLLLSLLILSGLCVADACRKADEAIKKNVGASIWLTNQALNEVLDRYTSVISSDLAEKAMSINGITEVEYGTELLVHAESFAAVMSEEQKLLYADMPDIRLSGITDVNGNVDFSSESVYLLSYEDTKGGAIIHQSLAQENDLKLGDKLTVKYGDDIIELTVSGIFATTVAGIQQLPPYLEGVNTVYTDIDSMWSLCHDGSLSYIYLRTDEPPKADSISAEMLRYAGEYPYGDTMEVSVDTAAYDSVSASLNSVNGTAVILIIGAVVMGSAILILLTYLTVKEREHEVGVLLAIGEQKIKLFAQMIIEVLIPAVAAITVSVIVSASLAPRLGNLIGIPEVTVTLKAVTVAVIYIVGTLLTMVAGIPSAIKILKYNPKKFLISAE